MKKIIFIIILFLLIFNLKSYAKYKIHYELECFEIIVQTDFDSPTYNIEYSTKQWTNQDVTIKIKFSEEITGMEGFDYNKGYYTKCITENEKNSIKVYDEAGNETTVNYEVNWIDKTKPQITGIENNSTYTETQFAEYFDNESGIQKIEKIFYGDLLIGLKKENNTIIKVYRKPKNIVSFNFYRIENGIESFVKTEKEKVEFSNLNSENSKYYVIATDINGNTYKSNILETENDLENEFKKENNKTFSKKGNYDIKITDYAGNETFYTIKLE